MIANPCYCVRSCVKGSTSSLQCSPVRKYCRNRRQKARGYLVTAKLGATVLAHVRPGVSALTRQWARILVGHGGATDSCLESPSASSQHPATTGLANKVSLGPGCAETRAFVSCHNGGNLSLRRMQEVSIPPQGNGMAHVIGGRSLMDFRIAQRSFLGAKSNLIQDLVAWCGRIGRGS